MLIRKANQKDFPAICELFENPEEFFLIYPNGQFPMTISQLEHLASLRTDLTVVYSDKELVGFANLYDLKPNHYVFIGNVVVASSFRGRGLGKSITRHMLRTAFRDYDLPQVRISVFCSNTPALLLYSQFGFVPYALETRQNPQGDKLALLHMSMDKENYQE